MARTVRHYTQDNIAERETIADYESDGRIKVERGTFRNPSFDGQIGRTYKTQVLHDGEVIRSYSAIDLPEEIDREVYFCVRRAQDSGLSIDELLGHLDELCC